MNFFTNDPIVVAAAGLEVLDHTAQVVHADTTSSVINIEFPVFDTDQGVSYGAEVVIIDTGSNASINNITLSVNGTDGTSVLGSAVLDQNQQITTWRLFSDNTWRRITDSYVDDIIRSINSGGLSTITPVVNEGYDHSDGVNPATRIYTRAQNNFFDDTTTMLGVNTVQTAIERLVTLVGGGGPFFINDNSNGTFTYAPDSDIFDANAGATYVTDTHGLLGTVGATVTQQALFDEVVNCKHAPVEMKESDSLQWWQTGPDGQCILGEVKISGDAGNTIVINPDGIFSDGTGGTLITEVDTNTIDLTYSGGNLSGVVRIDSSTGDNIITEVVDANGGIYAPPSTFDVSDGVNPAETVASGETLTISSEAFIEVVVSATRTVTVGINPDPPTGGSGKYVLQYDDGAGDAYTWEQIDVSLIMTDFDIADNQGVPNSFTVNNSDTVTLAGINGVFTDASTPDNVDIGLLAPPTGTLFRYIYTWDDDGDTWQYENINTLLTDTHFANTDLVSDNDRTHTFNHNLTINAVNKSIVLNADDGALDSSKLQLFNGSSFNLIATAPAGFTGVSGGVGTLTSQAVVNHEIIAPYTVLRDSAGNVEQELRFESGTEFYSGFKADSGMLASIMWTLPGTDSTGTQALVSNGAGILSWSNLVISELDTDSIDLTIASGVLSADLLLDSVTGGGDNIAVITPGQGLYVPPTGKFSEICDTDGDTYVRTEESADEDIVRIGALGVETHRLYSDRNEYDFESRWTGNGLFNPDDGLITGYSVGKSVLITEIMYNTTTAAQWLEFVNVTESSVDISGETIALIGGTTSGSPITIPADTILAPGQHLVVYSDVGTAPTVHPGAISVSATFSLGATGTWWETILSVLGSGTDIITKDGPGIEDSELGDTPADVAMRKTDYYGDNGDANWVQSVSGGTPGQYWDTLSAYLGFEYRDETTIPMAYGLPVLTPGLITSINNTLQTDAAGQTYWGEGVHFANTDLIADADRYHLFDGYELDIESYSASTVSTAAGQVPKATLQLKPDSLLGASLEFWDDVGSDYGVGVIRAQRGSFGEDVVQSFIYAAQDNLGGAAASIVVSSGNDSLGGSDGPAILIDNSNNYPYALAEFEPNGIKINSQGNLLLQTATSGAYIGTSYGDGTKDETALGVVATYLLGVDVDGKVVEMDIPAGLVDPQANDIVYVDATRGNDGTGEINNFMQPYLTIGAAYTAAPDGSTVYIRAGTYTGQTTITILNTKDVKFYAMPNVSIVNTTNDILFDVNDDATLSFKGHADFTDVRIFSTPGGQGTTRRHIELEYNTSTNSIGSDTFNINNCTGYIACDSIDDSNSKKCVAFRGSNIFDIYANRITNVGEAAIRFQDKDANGGSGYSDQSVITIQGRDRDRIEITGTSIGLEGAVFEQHTAGNLGNTESRLIRMRANIISDNRCIFLQGSKMDYWGDAKTTHATEAAISLEPNDGGGSGRHLMFTHHEGTVAALSTTNAAVATYTTGDIILKGNYLNNSATRGALHTLPCNHTENTNIVLHGATFKNLGGIGIGGATADFDDTNRRRYYIQNTVIESLAANDSVNFINTSYVYVQGTLNTNEPVTATVQSGAGQIVNDSGVKAIIINPFEF